MSKKERKEKRKCSKSKRMMIAFSLTTIGPRVISTISLAEIALSIFSLNKEAKIFNECVLEITENGKSASKAVHFCNGGQ